MEGLEALAASHAGSGTPTAGSGTGTGTGTGTAGSLGEVAHHSATRGAGRGGGGGGGGAGARMADTNTRPLLDEDIQRLSAVLMQGS